jgi:hypothetical protein
MKKALATLALGATVSIGAVASPTTADARWHHGFPVAPIVGGLAAGAILDAARPPGPTMTLMSTSTSISGRDVTSDANASGTDGVGTFTVSRIATE